MTADGFAAEFVPLLPPDQAIDMARHMLDHCPVVHSDSVPGGFWVINAYNDCQQVLRDPHTFQVGPTDGRGACRIPPDPEGLDRLSQPPLDSNLPIHRHFRRILNPYLALPAVLQHEAGIRGIIADLIDNFQDHGKCDLVAQLTRLFPTAVTFRELLGIEDEGELEECATWVRGTVYGLHKEDPQALAGLQHRFDDWCFDFVTRRRAEPSRSDLVDAILAGFVEDSRPLTETELVGIIQGLILGGFLTTADASANLVVAMIEHDLEDVLRSRPDIIDPFIEEVLRLEPPVSARARRVTRDVEIGGHAIRTGEKVLINYLAANRDPMEFDRPDELDVDRPQNRHLAFAAGIHRCIGSSLARLQLKIFMEEILSHLHNIRFADDGHERRFSFSAGSVRAVASLPVIFQSTTF